MIVECVGINSASSLLRLISYELTEKRGKEDIFCTLLKENRMQQFNSHPTGQ
jgi:hypothetical protein